MKTIIALLLFASVACAHPSTADVKWRAWTANEASRYLAHRFTRQSDGSSWQFMEYTSKGCRMESGLEERESFVSLKELLDGFTQSDGQPCGCRDGAGKDQ